MCFIMHYSTAVELNMVYFLVELKTNEGHLLRNIDNLMYAELQHITQYTQLHTLFYIPVFSPTAYSRQSANNAEKSSSTASKQSNIDFMNGLKA